MTAVEILRIPRTAALVKANATHWGAKLNQQEAASEFGIPASRLAELRRTGGGPAFTTSVGGFAKYRRADVQVFIENGSTGA